MATTTAKTAEKPKTYAQRQKEWAKANGIKPGSVVRVARVPTEKELQEWKQASGNHWYETAQGEMVGDFFEVAFFYDDAVMVNSSGSDAYAFPFFVLRGNGETSGILVVKLNDEYKGICSKRGVRTTEGLIKWANIDSFVKVREFLSQTSKLLDDDRIYLGDNNPTVELFTNGSRWEAGCDDESITIGCQDFKWKAIDDLIAARDKVFAAKKRTPTKKPDAKPAAKTTKK